MTAGKARTLVALVFVAALFGGAAAGILAGRYVHPTAEPTLQGEASLSTELQLTRDQQSQIRQIWEQVRDENQRSYGQGKALDDWRDEQYEKLLTEEQKKQYQQIYNEYQNRFTALNSQRELAFTKAVEKTKRLLTDQQRQRYEQILAVRLGAGRGIESQPLSTRPAPTFSASRGSKEVVPPG